MGLRRQRGVSGLMIAIILVFVAIGVLATIVLTRLNDSATDRNNTLASMARAMDALDQFAAAGGGNARLPCPADPTLAQGAANEGLELTNGLTDCQVPDGTLPWKTLAMRPDDAVDAWGR